MSFFRCFIFPKFSEISLSNNSKTHFQGFPLFPEWLGTLITMFLRGLYRDSLHFTIRKQDCHTFIPVRVYKLSLFDGFHQVNMAFLRRIVDRVIRMTEASFL